MLNFARDKYESLSPKNKTRVKTGLATAAITSVLVPLFPAIHEHINPKSAVMEEIDCKTELDSFIEVKDKNNEKIYEALGMTGIADCTNIYNSLTGVQKFSHLKVGEEFTACRDPHELEKLKVAGTDLTDARGYVEMSPKAQHAAKTITEKCEF